MPKHCVAANCKNSSDNKDVSVSFHKFPKNGEQRAEWIRQVKRTRAQWDGPTSDYTYVCSKHFTEDCYERGPQIKTDLGWHVRCQRILQKNAVPTIFLRPEPSYSEAKKPRMSKACEKRDHLRIVSEALKEAEEMDCASSISTEPEATCATLEAETEPTTLEAACQTVYVTERKKTKNKKIQAVIKGGKQKFTQTEIVETMNKSIQVGDGQVGNLDEVLYHPSLVTVTMLPPYMCHQLTAKMTMNSI